MIFTMDTLGWTGTSKDVGRQRQGSGVRIYIYISMDTWMDRLGKKQWVLLKDSPIGNYHRK